MAIAHDPIQLSPPIKERRTMLVVFSCPIVCATLFLMPLPAVAVSIASLAILHLVLLRAPRRLLRTLLPAAFYLVMLSLPAAVSAIRGSSALECRVALLLTALHSPLTTSLAIGAASLACSVSYSITSDLSRRQALEDAERYIRNILRLSPVPTIAPALSLMSSFIPLIVRVYHEVDDARRARGIATWRTPVALFSTMLIVCMHKAVKTEEALHSRG